MCLSIMQDIHAHLHPNGVLDPRRVAAIHCKAGKGRTGMIVSMWENYAGYFPSYDANLALRFYAVRRTKNQKGVTIPSQIRWVHYFARWLRMDRGVTRSPLIPAQNPVLLQSIRLLGIPRSLLAGTAGGSGKEVWFKIEFPRSAWESAVGKYSSKGKVVVERRLAEDYLSFQAPRGGVGITSLDHDVQMTFYSGGLFDTTKLFSFWFNTRFLGIMEAPEIGAAAALADGAASGADGAAAASSSSASAAAGAAAPSSAAAPVPSSRTERLCDDDGDEKLVLTLHKHELDKACKDKDHKLYVDSFRVELTFSSA
jgi:phosphatidylinositol-3,4,5-trisphosphate 3-phosphatase/dual-specificity protein phosphatase PTEN